MTLAAICRKFGAPLSLEQITLRDPSEDEILIDVKACAICHSDISYIRGEWGGDLPAVYGHEASGVVRKVGGDGSAFRVGDRVIATLIRHCDQCRFCASGSHVLCRGEFASDHSNPISVRDGDAILQGMNTGAFAESILIHQSQVTAIPENLPFEEASLIACGALTGYGAIFNTAKVSAGSSVVVVGCGGVGINAIQSARLAGADPIIAIDTAESKRTSAPHYGATHALDPQSEDLSAQIRHLTDGYGAEFVIVTVGAKVAIDSAHDYLAPNGAVVVVGMPPSGVMAQFEAANLASANQRILGSKMGDAQIERDVPAIIDAWRAGTFQLAPLISGRYRLDQINEAIDAVNRADVLRNVIIFD